MADNETPRPFGAGVKAKVVLMLAAFIVVIAASVIATDLLSSRDRAPATTAPARNHV